MKKPRKQASSSAGRAGGEGGAAHVVARFASDRRHPPDRPAPVFPKNKKGGPYAVMWEAGQGVAKALIEAREMLVRELLAGCRIPAELKEAKGPYARPANVLELPRLPGSPERAWPASVKPGGTAMLLLTVEGPGAVAIVELIRKAMAGKGGPKGAK